MNVNKISIIFTSYNHKEFLAQALDSLLDQTFKDFELIIVDDCSTDGSQNLIKSYATDSRVKLFLLDKNTGSYVHSSNFGASKASSEYIIFAQCDDFAESTQLEKLYNEMQSNPKVGVVYSSSRMIDINGNYLGSDFEYRGNKFRTQCALNAYINNLDMRDYLLDSCVIPNLSAALIKRSLFEKIGGLSSKYLVLADWDFWLKMSIECDFYYIRESLNNFRQHNSTIRNSVKLNLQIAEVFEMYYSFFNCNKISPLVKFHTQINIAYIWLSYFKNSKIIWLKTFFLLQKKALKYCFYFPLVFLIAATIFPFMVIYRKIKNISKINSKALNN